MIEPGPCMFLKSHLYSCLSSREKAMQPTPVLLCGKSHGWRSLVGCSPWGCEESDMTERLHFHFSLSCIGEGNGNPLQCSCLENPRDGGAWWAAVYWVAQSRHDWSDLAAAAVALFKSLSLLDSHRCRCLSLKPSPTSPTSFLYLDNSYPANFTQGDVLWHLNYIRYSCNMLTKNVIFMFI